MSLPGFSCSGVRGAAAANNAQGAAPPASTVETVIVTTPTLNLPFDNATVWILWYWTGQWGTGTTAVQVGLRRGTTTSAPLLNTNAGVTVTAGAVVVLSGAFLDRPGAASAVQYSLTMTGVGTTGAGGTNENCLMAFVL